MRSQFKVIIVGFLSILCALAGWNYVAAHHPVVEVIEKDPRNEGIAVVAHHQWFVNPSVLVFDLRRVSGEKSPLDVSRVLLQYADKLQSRNFGHVILAYKGAPKFMLQGEYFRELGKEYEFQNPVYTLRTLPENVYNLDGTPAFDTWTGGWIGVVGKQMEDLNNFHERWYLAEIASDS